MNLWWQGNRFVRAFRRRLSRVFIVQVALKDRLADWSDKKPLARDSRVRRLIKRDYYFRQLLQLIAGAKPGLNWCAFKFRSCYDLWNTRIINVLLSLLSRYKWRNQRCCDSRYNHVNDCTRATWPTNNKMHDFRAKKNLVAQWALSKRFFSNTLKELIRFHFQ